MERVSLDHDDIGSLSSFIELSLICAIRKSVSGTRREKQATFKRHASISIRIEKTGRTAMLHNLRIVQHRQLRLIF